MAKPHTGKRAQPSNRLTELKVGLTAGQVLKLQQLQADHDGRSFRQCIRDSINAGLRALLPAATPPAPDVAGRIGPAQGATLRRAA